MKKHEILTASVPVGTKDKVKALAEKEGRNLSNMVAELLKRGMKKKAA